MYNHNSNNKKGIMPKKNNPLVILGFRNIRIKELAYNTNLIIFFI